MNRMKRIGQYGGWIAITAAFVFGTMAANVATAGIANTKHNLVGATNDNRVTAGTDEICVFCHTPHAAQTGVGAPLWNKNLPSGTSFTMYSSTSMDGGAANLTGSPSLVCLSCHDGTQAMDNIINAPGSGGYQANGGGANGLGYTWNQGPNARVNAEGVLSSGVALLGTDLSNDHPIGIPYCGGGLTGSGAVVSGACSDLDFQTGTGANNNLKTATINSLQVFWVDTPVGTANTRQRTDIQLYTRNTNQPFVECGSCHDPHVEAGVGNAGQTFLRVSNAASAVCLSCHVK